MSKYRTNFVKGRNGQTVYAVEEYYPEEKEWGVVKIFTTRKAAEDEKQTLEMYGKKVKTEK
jgi:hypothetical protein